MKKLLLYTFAAFSLMGLTTSCSDFGDVNNDPEHLNPENMDYKLMFTQVQTQICGSDWDVWRNGCIYAANMMQHTTSADWKQGVFYTWSNDYNAAYWDGFYKGGRAAIRNIIEVIERWKDNPAYTNEIQYCRVMKAYMFQRMTDLYGDIPYFDAGKGALGGELYPKYDTQEAIYDDLLKELDEVNTALKSPSGTNSITSADLIYAGKPEKWRMFANSLMLRVATRLSKVAPDKAATWAKKAVSNGLFASADDEAILKHTDGSTSNDSAEPYGKIFSNEDPQAFYMSEYFIGQLAGTNDPRLRMIATKCEKPNTKWSSGNDFDLGDSSEELVGMPIGYETSDGAWSIKKAPGYPGDALWRSYYALPNRKTYARPDVPTMLVTYAENQLLLADAAARGLIDGGLTAAKSYLEAGVRAAMKQFSYYSAASSDYDKYLSSSNVDTYVNSRLVVFGCDVNSALKEINWQYYVNTFCDEYETFANWRRTGYPELKSVYQQPGVSSGYPNSVSTDIPRRFTYPTAESQDNTANYNDAVKRLTGGDKMTSRVWWDK